MGFRLVGQECEDIDECKEFDFCYKDNHCTNTVGSYSCGCWRGYEAVGIVCTDIDECSNKNICPTNSMCQNSVGNFSCQCDAGFEGDFCTDVDECSLIGSCHLNATCSDTVGSYVCSCDSGFHGDGKTCEEGQCDDRRCPSNQKCVSPTKNECGCKDGFSIDHSRSLCEDIDECFVGHDCDRNATCTNSEGSFSCECISGFFGDGKTCVPGECTEDICPWNEECLSPTSNYCICKDGFERNRIGVCVDTDECSSNQHNCDQRATCMNEVGTYRCNCHTGYAKTGVLCTDLDECETGDHSCHKKATCTNTLGSYNCSCNEGFVGNGTLCYPVSDECATGQHNCDPNAKCKNNKESFSCHCNSGFDGDGISCTDFDECTNNYHTCSKDSKCTNTEGSFVCNCERGTGELCRLQWILVLNSNWNGKWKPALLINSEGRQRKLTCFEPDKKTEASDSCSINWQNQLYIFGGGNKRQISKLNGHKLKRLGSLTFDHEDGGCSVMNNQFIYLCFGSDSDDKQCRWSAGPLTTFTKVALSNHDHRFNQISCSETTLVAVGSLTNKKSEKFEDGKWSEIKEPPVYQNYWLYDVTFNSGKFYYFGGEDGSLSNQRPLSSILCLNAVKWTWSNVGQMRSPRHNHRVILIDNTYMVIGGVQGDLNNKNRVPLKKNEACLLKKGKFACEEKMSSLNNDQYNGFVLFPVRDNYRNC